MDGKTFVEIYTVRDGCRQAFVNVAKLLKFTDWKQHEREIFVPGVKNKIVDYEGFPHVVVRIRFVNAIAKAGDNVVRVRDLLNQVFNEKAIQFLFPEVWLDAHNYMARKQARWEAHVRQQRRALGKGEFDPIHRDAMRMTQTTTVRQYARRGGVL